MKIFLSALENGSTVYDTGEPLAHYFVKQGLHMKYNLISYFYIRKKHELAEFIRDNTDEIMVDSGAHTLQRRNIDWVDYTKGYAEFIKKYDRPNVIGYFEMDVDNIIGYDKVLELRKILENVSDKIIPVWHRNRGIDDFKKMCEKYSGKIVAITGFKNDIREDQFLMFLKCAREYGCKVHCLGMTKKKILDTVPFDYVDSSSWKQNGIYGLIKGKGKVSREFSKCKREVVFMENYKHGMEMQDHYYQKWRHVCKD